MGRRSRSRSPPTKDKKHHSKRKVSASDSDREARKEKKEKKDKKKSVDTASPAKYGIETRSSRKNSMIEGATATKEKETVVVAQNPGDFSNFP